jgi:hypothetical protein
MNNFTDEDEYFAVGDAENLVSHLQNRSQSWFDEMTNSNYMDKIQRSWMSYYGIYYENGHAISYGGETGELVNLAVNHYHNIAEHMLTMITATRPSFQARAINTDAKSQIQTELANGLLDYYMREKRLEQDLKTAAEYAIVMGSGYIKMEWNATTGRVYGTVDAEYEPEVDENGDPIIDERGDVIYQQDAEGNYIERTPAYPIYEGDAEFSVMSPFDVVFDSSKGHNKHDWQLARSFKNKYDLAAKYPEFKDEIKALRTKSDIYRTRISTTPFDETTDVPVYEFYHKPTESLPKGRYVLYLSTDVILIDSVLPYTNLPLFRISPANILGTPFGYTSMFDLLPLQDAVNSLYSTILTNQSSFGVQSVYVERGSDVQVEQIQGGMNFIQGNPGFNPPQPLNLTSTPTEIFNFVKQLEQAMETISGVNSVVRGNPEKSLQSGNALALVQSQALQFMSGLQQSYIRLIEDVGTNLIQMLKDFADVPRIASIAGKSNVTYMKEFKSDDLSSINRVIVDAGNALAQTTAGRSEMASQMIQMGIVTTPEQYMSVINTGNLETMTEGANKELLLVRAERERLIDGKTPVMAILTDDHSLHIREHKAALADPDLRMDAELVKRVLDHIQEHIDILSDPNVANILSMLNQKPLGPVGGTPAAPVEGQVPNQQGSQEASDLLNNPQAQSVSTNQQAGSLPNPAQPPAGQPSTPQDVFAANAGGNKV